MAVPFTVLPAGLDEEAALNSVRSPLRHPERLARKLAAAKAVAVSVRSPQTFVLAADTIVVHRGCVLGKPEDAREAEAMLKRLRDRTHRVITAVAVVAANGRRPLLDHAVTRVKMRRYSDEDMAAYIERGNPFDKAGGYAIQDEGLAPVERYEGCYCNVVGLPLWTALRLLQQSGFVGLEVASGRLLPPCLTCPSRP